MLSAYCGVVTTASGCNNTVWCHDRMACAYGKNIVYSIGQRLNYLVSNKLCFGYLVNTFGPEVDHSVLVERDDGSAVRSSLTAAMSSGLIKVSMSFAKVSESVKNVMMSQGRY